MELDYITTYDLFNRASWPKEHMGLYSAGYHLVQHLQDNQISLNFCSPLEKYKTPITRLKWLFYQRLFKQRYYSWAEPSIVKHYARQVEQNLSNSQADIAFCPENAIPISGIKCNKPLVLWIDAAIGSLIGFYSYLDDLCEETKQNLYKLEKAAFSRCDRIVFTSDWAAESAAKLYRLPAEKIMVIPRGGNLNCDRTHGEVMQFIEARPTDKCQLLFIGVEWERKGGDFAVNVAKHLHENGLNVELKIVGVKPKLASPVPEYIKSIGYIDKSTPVGRDRLNRLFAGSHFLILHTQADCGPNVLIEASSYGVPSVCSNVGGIPTLIRDGQNGQTFPLETDPLAYSHYITELFRDRQQYQSLAISSFAEYQSRLNWKVTARAFQTLFNEVLNS